MRLVPFPRINVQDPEVEAGIMPMLAFKMLLEDSSTLCLASKDDKASMEEMGNQILDQFLDFNLKICL
jgi:hypothetical protein